jgi:hypothetical protein
MKKIKIWIAKAATRHRIEIGRWGMDSCFRMMITQLWITISRSGIAIIIFVAGLLRRSLTSS